MLPRRHFNQIAAVLALTAGAPAALARVCSAPAGFEDVDGDVRALYRRFLDAQNARDLAQARRALWESPDFLWVSDGRPYWGPDALVARMRAFQAAEVWRVEPDFNDARTVALTDDAAYLALTLTLVIGAAADPARLRWLVGVLCRREAADWRIAALFTTGSKV